MDKEPYESYEYLTSGTSECPGTENQFFVIQDDGTLLINRQVQYVTQVQDVQEVVQEDEQSCTVYDVTPQQFYVDVDNSTELISVSNQFILSEGVSNIYTNNFLLQPVTSTSEQKIVENTNEKFKKENKLEPVSTLTIKQADDFTGAEITLTDEQYNILEKKGWILLETNEKVFVLDTLGLHDITKNDKLIEKLKNETMTCDNMETDSELDGKISNASEPMEHETLDNQPESVKFVIGSNSIEETKNTIQENLPFIVNNKEVSNTIKHKIFSENETKVSSVNKINKTDQSLTTIKTPTDGNFIKLKTNFPLKDIPDRIFLGKTKTGKNLVAKVVKKNNTKIPNGKKLEIRLNNSARPKKTDVLVLPRHVSKLINVGFPESKLKDLIQQAMKDTTVCSIDDVMSTGYVIMELVQVPEFKLILKNSYLMISKETKQEDSDGKLIQVTKPTLITGTLKFNQDDQLFLHLPKMIQDIKAKCEAAFVSNEPKIVHVHVCETRSPNKDGRLLIILDQRYRVADLIPIKKHTPIFACTACASIFVNEDELYEHQQSDCVEIDPEENLTIDLDKINDNAAVDTPQNVKNANCLVLENNNEKSYCCLKCSTKFSKYCNLQRHQKIHKVKITNDETSDKDKTGKMYKCKICRNEFAYSITLTKHILSKHIQINKEIENYCFL